MVVELMSTILSYAHGNIFKFRDKLSFTLYSCMYQCWDSIIIWESFTGSSGQNMYRLCSETFCPTKLVDLLHNYNKNKSHDKCFPLRILCTHFRYLIISLQRLSFIALILNSSKTFKIFKPKGCFKV
jgi:hypothetical protein